jgi:hypothetical protein
VRAIRRRRNMVTSLRDGGGVPVRLGTPLMVHQ